MEDILEFTGVERGFGRLPVLRGVSGRVARGELLLVMGANGAGKSTLLRCLAGLLRAQGGSIAHRERGRELAAAERRRRVGYVAPDLALYEPLTVAENLRFFCRLRRVPDERAEALRQRVDLPPDRPVGALSSGMRQRLRWAWALLHEPWALLLDEPFQNLDPPGEALARELLAAHRSAGGAAVVATPAPLRVDPSRTLEL